jgi:GNAT superfamily N-acetyltransferase
VVPEHTIENHIMIDLTIATVTATDAADIRDLLIELGYELPVQDITKNLTDLHRHPHDRILIARSGDRAVGLGALHVIPVIHVPESLGRITALVVSEVARGQGVGGLLVELLEDAAMKAGCTRMEVTSGDHRPGAHEFYQRLGYEVNERRFIKRLG